MQVRALNLLCRRKVLFQVRLYFQALRNNKVSCWGSRSSFNGVS